MRYIFLLLLLLFNYKTNIADASSEITFMRWFGLNHDTGHRVCEIEMKSLKMWRDPFLRFFFCIIYIRVCAYLNMFNQEMRMVSYSAASTSFDERQRNVCLFAHCEFLKHAQLNRKFFFSFFFLVKFLLSHFDN